MSPQLKLVDEDGETLWWVTPEEAMALSYELEKVNDPSVDLDALIDTLDEWYRSNGA